MQKIQTEKSDPWKGHPCIVAIVGFEPTGQSRKCRRSTARPCEFPLKCADAFDDRSSSHGFCVVVVICGLGYIKDAFLWMSSRGSGVATISLLVSDLWQYHWYYPARPTSPVRYTGTVPVTWQSGASLYGSCWQVEVQTWGWDLHLPKQCAVCEIPQLATLFRSGLTHRDKENTRLAAILAKWPDQRKRNFMGVIAYILTHR